MVEVPLIFGRLTTTDYEDSVASDARIDTLRERMTVKENESFTKDYFNADIRAIGNSVQVFFKDGSSTDKVTVDYPVGLRHRREEGIELLKLKFDDSIRGKLSKKRADKLIEICNDHNTFAAMLVSEFMDLWVV